MKHSDRLPARAVTGAALGGVAVVAAAVLLMLPSLVLGAPKGHDFAYHAAWIEAFVNALGLGGPYPRWLGGLWFGAGGADFFFYPPMPYWVAGALERLVCRGCGAEELMVAVALAALAASGLGFRALARRFAGHGPATAAAVVYMALPYHLAVDWYDRQALAELVAIAVLPWQMAAFIDCMQGRGGRLRMALLTAVMVFSHLPTLVIASFGYAALLPFLGRRRGWRPAGSAGVAGVLGLGLGAVYWYPAVSLLGSVRTDLLGGAMLTQNHFIEPAAIAAGRFVATLWQPLAALSVLSVLSLALLRPREGALPAIVPTLIGLTWVMATPLTKPLWSVTPLAQVQFPWRFLVLSDLAFGLAAVVAFGALADPETGPGRRRVAGLALSAIVLVAGLRLAGLAESRFRTEVGGDWPPLVVGAAEWLPAETRGSGALRTYHDYEALRATARNAANQPTVALDGRGRVEVIAAQPRRIVFTADLPAPARIVVHRTYWRFWRLESAASGAEIGLSPTPGFPLINAELPAGRSRYVLELPRLQAERIGAALSALSLAVLTAWLALSRHRRRS